jgi:hypothetical protein
MRPGNDVNKRRGRVAVIVRQAEDLSENQRAGREVVSFTMGGQHTAKQPTGAAPLPTPLTGSRALST